VLSSKVLQNCYGSYLSTEVVFLKIMVLQQMSDVQTQSSSVYLFKSEFARMDVNLQLIYLIDS